MFWWDKENPLATFIDKREFEGKACDGRNLKVAPDIVMDFTHLDFPDDTYDLVVFDPPHLVRAWDKSWLAQKYGRLEKDWRVDLKKWFDEWLRVLKPTGTLIFKWNEYQVKVQEIIKIFGVDPLFGNRTSKNTLWIVYKK
jgi:SAM-dependent methyltransferase